jgi:hypothetical protein
VVLVVAYLWFKNAVSVLDYIVIHGGVIVNSEWEIMWKEEIGVLI